MNPISFINDSGIVGWIIVTVGVFAVALASERFYELFYKFEFNSQKFFDKLVHLLKNKQFAEAISLCQSFKDKPLARACSRILEKSDRDESTLQQIQEQAISETAPLFSKRIHHISTIANVATLLGLLGTIHGLILSFSAVAKADPSQKQVLLANGISIALYTTALGLIISIPLVVFYSFLLSKQNEHLNNLFEKTGKLVEYLGSYDFFELQKKKKVDDFNVSSGQPHEPDSHREIA